MSPRSFRPRVIPPADVAKAIARGPIQLTHFPPQRRPPSRWLLRLLATGALFSLLGFSLLALGIVAGGPACDPLSVLPWLECPHGR